MLAGTSARADLPLAGNAEVPGPGEPAEWSADDRRVRSECAASRALLRCRCPATVACRTARPFAPSTNRMPPSAPTANSAAPNSIQMDGRRSASVIRAGPEAQAGRTLPAVLIGSDGWTIVVGSDCSAVVIGSGRLPILIGTVSSLTVTGSGSCQGE